MLDHKLLMKVLGYLGKNSGAYYTCKYWKLLIDENHKVLNCEELNGAGESEEGEDGEEGDGRESDLSYYDYDHD